jgi:hypothetical protein
MGVKKPSLLKSYLRDFERYIGTYYDFSISKGKKAFGHPSGQNVSSPPVKINPFDSPRSDP